MLDIALVAAVAEVQRHLEAVQQINKMPRQLGIFLLYLGHD
jgi:hypothetical protein